MNLTTFCRTIALLVVAVTVLPTSQAVAGSPVSVLPIQPFPISALGVTTSLTTSGYSFVVGNFFPPTPLPGHASPDYVILGPLTFPASFALTNHSFSAIEFTVPKAAGPVATATAVNAVPLIVFSVYDAKGNLVWSSWTDPGNLTTGDATLAAGGVWKLTAQIPLRVNNVWLDGTYTLVANVNGTPDFSATASFQVTPRPILDPPGPTPLANGAGAAK